MRISVNYEWFLSAYTSSSSSSSLSLSSSSSSSVSSSLARVDYRSPNPPSPRPTRPLVLCKMLRCAMTTTSPRITTPTPTATMNVWLSPPLAVSSLLLRFVSVVHISPIAYTINGHRKVISATPACCPMLRWRTRCHQSLVTHHVNTSHTVWLVGWLVERLFRYRC